MSKSVIGLFRDPHEARAAWNDLHNNGFAQEDLSLLAREGAGEMPAGARDTRSLESSTGTGAALGGATGLVLGLAALAIPGIGPIVAAGPLAAALTGAGIGAATGGMVGAFSEMGVPETEAGAYAEGIRRGGTLLVVKAATEDLMERAESVLNRHGAIDVNERVEFWRRQGWSGFDPDADTATFGDEGSPSEYGGPASAEDRTRRAARSYQRDLQL